MSGRGAEGIVGDYLALRAEADADLLAMQMGDFYEFFAEDAETVGRELDLKVSQKSSGGESYAMAGVPVDDVQPYLRALVQRGYRVAVADQHQVDGDIERRLTRTVTPGTLVESEDEGARYLAAVVEVEGRYGVAFADVTTGRFLVSTLDALAGVLTECYRFDPVELLPGPALRNDGDFLDRIAEETDARITEVEANAFAPGAASHALREQFGAEVEASLDLAAPAVRAAGAILAYVESAGLGVAASMTRLTPFGPADHVELDATTQRNLELTTTMSPGAEGSLLEVLDHTVTSAGGRRLREWLVRPRRDRDLIERRLACVDALAGAALSREAIVDELDGVADLERLASRTAHGSAGPRELARIREALAGVPALVERVEDDPRLAESPLAGVFGSLDLGRVDGLREELEAALADDPPGTVGEGGVFRRGYDAALDDVVERYEAALDWVDSLAEREKREHGITHLQVGRNRTDGYYLQVGQSETGKVPEDYREVKTLSSSVRYTTEALAEREREILRLEERRAELAAALFESLRESVAAEAALVQDVGRALATLDVYAGLATHAATNGWVRPEIAGDERVGEAGALAASVEIEAGRHPVVEQTTEFVPNDAALDGDRRFLLVTGPNMSGKSTFLRQTALIVLLAQVGSFVPAERARVAPVDAIFTRVGALDELAQGRSTFMVEMAELARILNAATEDSLVILDEVGRGTSTYDGISIAWAATEYLHNEVGSLTLFATHYHELTALADHLPRVVNLHVSAEERDGSVTFLRTVEPGPTDRSYGIHVAELAGVPRPVVSRATDVLARLRAEKAIEARGGAGESRQVVFDLEAGRMRPASGAADGGAAPGSTSPEEAAILEELAGTDLEEITPVELMAKVAEWRDRIEE